MWNMIVNEGPIIIPLLFCSIAVWAIFMERLWFLHKFGRQLNGLFVKSRELLEQQKINEARGLGHQVHRTIGNPYLTLFDREGLDRGQWENKVGRRLQESAASMKGGLWIMGTVGALAPFIGLFGTVIGIIKSFDDIATAGGKSGFAVVASGLSEALIATAAGILVAIVSVAFYNYFQSRLQKMNLLFRNKLEDLMDLL